MDSNNQSTPSSDTLTTMSKLPKHVEDCRFKILDLSKLINVKIQMFSNWLWSSNEIIESWEILDRADWFIRKFPSETSIRKLKINALLTIPLWFSWWVLAWFAEYVRREQQVPIDMIFKLPDYWLVDIWAIQMALLAGIIVVLRSWSEIATNIYQVRKSRQVLDVISSREINLLQGEIDTLKDKIHSAPYY